MSGLGGLNKSPDGVVIGLVQLQLPTVVTKTHLAEQTKKICAMVRKARKGMPTMDLVVFPEYSLHGLSMDTNPEIMCRLDGPEVAAFRQACKENRIWGCFSIMELNPGGYPYNSGIIVDDGGDMRLYYRKMHPWVPVEPWEPGNKGIPVCDGPNGSKVALIICHDGMFPEMARECAYKGANIMLRTAGYTAPIRHSWRISNQSNAFSNLMYTANVCMAGSDGIFNSMGEGMPKCDPVLLEPIFDVKVTVPNEFTSRVHGLISGRRGQILGYDAKEGWAGWDEVNAYLPQSELHDLIVDLRSLTLGVGTFAWKFDHLQELTGRLADKVIEQRLAAAAH